MYLSYYNNVSKKLNNILPPQQVKKDLGKSPKSKAVAKGKGSAMKSAKKGGSAKKKGGSAMKTSSKKGGKKKGGRKGN